MLVTIIEIATFDDRDPHRLEVADSRGKEIGGRMVLRRHRPPFDLKGNTEALATQRQWQYRAGRLNSRRRFEPLLQVNEKLTLVGTLIFDLRQSHVERKNVFRMQTAVHSLQTPETLNEQSRP